MYQKILQKLKTKYANLGFSDKVLEGVATQLSNFVTEEDKIATAVEGAETMLKSFQSFADSRVNTYKTEADNLKTRLAELEKSKGGNPNPSTPPTGDDVPDYVKQMQKTMEQMQQALQGFQQGQFESAEKVEELVNTVSQNYDAFKQSATDIGFSYTKPPENSGSPEEESETLAKMIRQGTEEIVKQKQN